MHLPSDTAVVADLHLGYAGARQRSGEAVPFDSLDEELSGLSRVLRQHGTQRLVVAGDLLEDGRCHGAWAAFQDWLNRSQVELVAVVPGNHDRGLETWTSATQPIPLHADGFTLGGWRVFHGDGLVPAGPVVHGHEHPCLRWAPRTARCSAALFRQSNCSRHDRRSLLSGRSSALDPAGLLTRSIRRERSVRAALAVVPLLRPRRGSCPRYGRPGSAHKQGLGNREQGTENPTLFPVPCSLFPVD